MLGVGSSLPGTKVEHSHGEPAASKLPAVLQEQIINCIQNDCTKSAKQIQLGYGMPCMPAEISPVAANIDVVSRAEKKARVDPNI